jgi:hypothetical protein
MSEINLAKEDFPKDNHKTRPKSTKIRIGHKNSSKIITMKNVPFNKFNVLRVSLDKIITKKGHKEPIILSLLKSQKPIIINKSDDTKIINEEKESRKILEEDEIKLKNLEEKIKQQKKIMEEKKKEISRLENNTNQLKESIKEKENSIEKIKKDIDDYKKNNEDITNFIENFNQPNNILNDGFDDLNDLDNYPYEDDPMGNSNNNSLYPNIDQMTYEQILELEEQIGNISNGLSDEEMKHLKREKYIKYKYLDDKCIICQYIFKELETIVVFPCNHCFHFPCIKPWLSTQHHCPLCKKDIRQEKEKEN